MGLVRDLHIDAFIPRKGNIAGIVLEWVNFTDYVCIFTLGTAICKGDSYRNRLILVAENIFYD